MFLRRRGPPRQPAFSLCLFTAARIWSWGCLPNVSSAKRSRRKANRPSFHGPLVHGTPGRGRLPPQGPCARLASGNPASSPGWLGRLRPSPGRRPPPGTPCPWQDSPLHVLAHGSVRWCWRPDRHPARGGQDTCLLLCMSPRRLRPHQLPGRARPPKPVGSGGEGHRPGASPWASPSKALWAPVKMIPLLSSMEMGFRCLRVLPGCGNTSLN